MGQSLSCLISAVCLKELWKIRTFILFISRIELVQLICLLMTVCIYWGQGEEPVLNCSES